jgi:hypothetical protein
MKHSFANQSVSLGIYNWVYALSTASGCSKLSNGLGNDMRILHKMSKASEFLFRRQASNQASLGRP